MDNQSGWEWVRFEEERERWELLSESEQRAVMQRSLHQSESNQSKNKELPWD